jgi:hypothetical protein
MLQYADTMVLLRASLGDEYHLATLLKLSLDRKDFINDTGVMGLARCNISNVIENSLVLLWLKSVNFEKMRCFTNAI